MNKTAMMELIEWIDSEIVYHAKEVNPLDNEFNKIHSSMIVALKDVKVKAIELRDTVERGQIKDAYNQGYREGEVDNSLSMKDVSEFSNADTYYTQTYQSK